MTITRREFNETIRIQNSSSVKIITKLLLFTEVANKNKHLSKWLLLRYNAITRQQLFVLVWLDCTVLEVKVYGFKKIKNYF